MTLADLISDVVGTSQKRNRAFKNYENSETSFEKAMFAMKTYLSSSFNEYRRLKSVPIEPFNVYIYNPEWVRAINEGERRELPFTINKVNADLIIGSQQELGMHELLDFSEPVNLQSRFADFVDEHKNLNLRVLRHRRGYIAQEDEIKRFYQDDD